jgi:hypothetical protein
MMADEDISRLTADLLTVKEDLYATRQRESTALTACRELEDGRLTDRQKLQARVYFLLFDFRSVATNRKKLEYTLHHNPIHIRQTWSLQAMEGALLKASKERADAVQKLDALRRDSGGSQKGGLGDFAGMFGGKDTKGMQELKGRLREVTDQLGEQKVPTAY